VDAGDVGRLLRAWRKRALLTQEQLAERAGLSVRTIRRLESDDPTVRPHSTSLQMLAVALNLTEADRAALAAAVSGQGRTADPEDPPTSGNRSIPRQLPANVHGFVGRDDDIAHLDKIMSDLGGVVDESAPIVISAIDGTAGIGKTALAVHWAHRVKQHFPDGQLYLNLRGYGPGQPVGPDDALAAMLRSLGVDPDRIPAGVDERSALVRSTLATRRMLILLDNAKDSEQVRHLLPGSDALVLVTSRRKLRALSVHHGARHLTLDLLSERDALELLVAVIGRNRVDSEPAEASAIVELCARLPLALRLAAERVGARPGVPLGELVTELADHRGRLAALSIDESPDTDLLSVFTWSYDALDPEAARMFDLLGLHPGNGIAVSAAAALAGVPPARAAATLRRLANVSMLEERLPERFEMHDLLREYARERADEHGGDYSAARGRLLQWYVHTAANARAQLVATPHELPVASHPPEGITPEQFGSHHAAVGWFDAEQDAIVKIVQSVDDLGHYESAAVLGQLAWPYCYLRGLWQQMRVVGEAGVELAIAVGNPLLEARIRSSLSSPYGQLEGFAEKEVATSQHALSIFVRLDNRQGQATSLLNLGVAYHGARRFVDARKALERARELYLQDGNQLYAAFAVNNLAWVFIDIDLLDDALNCARRAVDVIQGSSEPYRLVPALVTVATVHAARGEYGAALQSYRRAAAVAQSLGNNEVIPLGTRLGHRLLDGGAETEAIDVWREVYRICLEQNEPAAEEVQRLLASVGTPVRRTPSPAPPSSPE
jgi:transcriptional regulator with XRE-family HTH domain/tetratricopeptide (TPR) repeat protein